MRSRIVWRLARHDGDPVGAQVWLRPTAALVGGEPVTTVLPDPVHRHVRDGVLDVEVVATDDPVYQPEGWVWEVSTDLSGIPDFHVEAPAGEVVDLSTAQRLAPPAAMGPMEGPRGPAGVGVVSISQPSPGSMVVTLSDGQVTTLLLPAGEPGRPGGPGRDGVDSMVPGPQGVGIASVEAVDGALAVTLTDGRVIPVAVPAGVTAADLQDATDALWERTVEEVSGTAQGIWEGITTAQEIAQSALDRPDVSIRTVAVDGSTLRITMTDGRVHTATLPTGSAAATQDTGVRDITSEWQGLVAGQTGVVAIRRVGPQVTLSWHGVKFTAGDTWGSGGSWTAPSGFGWHASLAPAAPIAEKARVNAGRGQLDGLLSNKIRAQLSIASESATGSMTWWTPEPFPTAPPGKPIV